MTREKISPGKGISRTRPTTHDRYRSHEVTHCLTPISSHEQAENRIVPDSQRYGTSSCDGKDAAG